MDLTYRKLIILFYCNVSKHTCVRMLSHIKIDIIIIPPMEHKSAMRVFLHARFWYVCD